MNGGTMGICVLGTYTTVLPTTSAIHGTARILGWKAQKENLNPFDSATHAAGYIPRIAGHRSSGTGTECPGNMFYNYLPSLRQKVQDCINGVLFTQNIENKIINIYPNPASNKVFVEANNSISEIKIFNNLGQMIMELNPNLNKTEIPLESLPKGIYFVKIKYLENYVTKKLVVQ
jgi:hypothetical protein